jgi:glucosamine-phosphate N-acetyltransferase
MKIREINFNDFKKIFKLFNQLNDKLNNCEDLFKDYLLRIKSDNSKYILIIEDEINDVTELVGTCSILIEQKIIHDYGIVAHIEDLIIDEKYKGKKYGSVLLKEVIDIAKNLDCYKIILNCKDEIKDFYIKNGFEFNQLQGSIYFKN